MVTTERIGEAPPAPQAPVRPDSVPATPVGRFLSAARHGWLDVRRTVVLPGRDRSLRFVAVMLFLQRASYLAPALLTVGREGSQHYLSPVVNAGLLAAMVAWNVALATAVWRRGWFARRLVHADVALTCALLVAVSANVQPGLELSAANWATRFALGTAALIGAAYGPRMLFGMVATVVGVATLAVSLRTGSLPPQESYFISFANSCLWFAISIHFMRRYLCAQADAMDEANRQRLAVETAQAGDWARFNERLRHYRALHDTVLATLTAIARGGLDHDSQRVRRRCAAEADYIRRLLAEDGGDTCTTLGNRLAQVADDAAGLGLRVHLYHSAVPAEFPAPVVDAVCEAAREALNNVARHAGVEEAWLTTEWSDDRLAVRVVDRGVGFDPELTPYGFGLRRSISERMREVGGELQLFSMPGEGSSIELFWVQPGSGSQPA